MADSTKHSDSEQSAAAKPITFVRELEALINRYSLENETDTPDFILADYVRGCLDNLKITMRARDAWYKFNPWGSHSLTGVTDLQPSDVPSQAEVTLRRNQENAKEEA